jgi:SAM-dependent methyltransferase
MRAELHLIVNAALVTGWQIDVFAPESLTPFAARLREVFPRFVGSEFLPDAVSRQRINARHKDVTHQDVQALTFADQSFDLYVSNEILEHVPSIETTLKEARRVLRPAGKFVSTFPFRFMHENGLEKARIVGSSIEHLTEPEYHGNPVDPGRGSLVFTIPGWDILDVTKRVGFRDARMHFISSPRLGVTSSEVGGIFVMIAHA